ncbi:hypothetical protein [Tautonia plasticadhaerens]|uniref:Uncharacterized protein n=1 Tax=Tautonia plasticadhaerens TaxID=2527974 RepID=A0A518GZJ3_9BACT|nr:hypothetical protein [Tautonia plasticadhaerens]QDV34007.1 hypothetical protein ElP_18880 [Tautonia plasticadhaerens]
MPIKFIAGCCGCGGAGGGISLPCCAGTLDGTLEITFEPAALFWGAVLSGQTFAMTWNGLDRWEWAANASHDGWFDPCKTRNGIYTIQVRGISGGFGNPYTWNGNSTHVVGGGECLLGGSGGFVRYRFTNPTTGLTGYCVVTRP